MELAPVPPWVAESDRLGSNSSCTTPEGSLTSVKTTIALAGKEVQLQPLL